MVVFLCFSLWLLLPQIAWYPPNLLLGVTGPSKCQLKHCPNIMVGERQLIRVSPPNKKKGAPFCEYDIVYEGISINLFQRHDGNIFLGDPLKGDVLLALAEQPQLRSTSAFAAAFALAFAASTKKTQTTKPTTRARLQ